MSKIYNLLACHRSRAKKNRMITWIVGIKYGSTKIIWTLSNRFRKALFKIFFFQISRWCCKYSSRSRDMWYVNTSYVERKIIFFSNHHSQPRPSSPSKPLPFSRRGGAGGEITGRRVLPLLPVRLSRPYPTAERAALSAESPRAVRSPKGFSSSRRRRLAPALCWLLGRRRAERGYNRARVDFVLDLLVVGKESFNLASLGLIELPCSIWGFSPWIRCGQGRSSPNLSCWDGCSDPSSSVRSRTGL